MKRLSVMLPSRGRPEKLKRAIESLTDKARYPDRLEIIVGVDADDAQTREAAQSLPVVPLISPRPNTLGRVCDRLAGAASGDVLMWFTDDLLMKTDGWDEETENAVLGGMLEDYGILYPVDPQVGPYFSSLPIMTSKMADALRMAQGFMWCPYFPYWFGDTWIDEIGDMIGLKAPIDVHVELLEGRGETHGLRDLPYWLDFFEATRAKRAQAAGNIIDRMYRRLPGLQATCRAKLAERAQICAIKTKHMRDPAFIERWTANASADANPRYDEAKAQAEGVWRNLRQEAREAA